MERRATRARVTTGAPDTTDATTCAGVKPAALMISISHERSRTECVSHDGGFLATRVSGKPLSATLTRTIHSGPLD